jgi:hypothetical protein
MLLIRLCDGTVRREKRSQLSYTGTTVPSDKLQCPLCLKTYSLYGDKGYNSSGAVSFMQHLQRHEVATAKKAQEVLARKFETVHRRRKPAKFWRENLEQFTTGKKKTKFWREKI